MAGQPFGQPDLIVPGKTVPGILGEFNVVRRIAIQKIVPVQGQFFKVAAGKLPFAKDFPVMAKVPGVVYPLVFPKGDVEQALFVKAAEAVIPGPVEVVEKLGGFPGVLSSPLQ